MRLHQQRLTRLIALPLLASLAFAAGGGDDGGSSSSKTTEKASGAQLGDLSGTLNGSGSSFQNNLELAAIDAFTGEASGVTINYNAVGSGQGKTELANQVTDFAGTDSLVKDADKATFKGGDFLYFPIATAPIAVTYHLSGVTKLTLSPATLVKIFGRSIKTWDDAAIKADNPGATLPSKPITVVHRADGSGTTNVFTSYLTKVGGSDWTLGTGDTVAWATDTQAGNKNAGVAQVVTQTDGAIGYVDYSDAKAAKLDMASVENKAGKAIAPSTAGCQAAAEGSTVAANLTLLPLDAEGDGAYPVCAPTYVLAYKSQTDKAKGAILKAYLSFVLTDGQKLAESLNFAPLPKDLAKKAIDQIDQLTVAAS